MRVCWYYCCNDTLSARTDPFDFDFNFDSEGKLVKTEQTPHGVRQRRNITITDANGNEVLPAQVNVGFGGRAGGPAFSGGLGGGAGGLTIAAPVDLVDKVRGWPRAFFVCLLGMHCERQHWCAHVHRADVRALLPRSTW